MAHMEFRCFNISISSVRLDKDACVAMRHLNPVLLSSSLACKSSISRRNKLASDACDLACDLACDHWIDFNKYDKDH